MKDFVELEGKIVYRMDKLVTRRSSLICHGCPHAVLVMVQLGLNGAVYFASAVTEYSLS